MGSVVSRATVAVLLRTVCISSSFAITANSCSGNGLCGTFDSCECYKGFTGGDCSHRLCPFGLAWTDVHQGDLNHDGSNALSDEAYVMDERRNAHLETPEFFPTKKDKGGFAADPNEAHFYQECSSKGICERETGTCRCFRGYTGSSCQRSKDQNRNTATLALINFQLLRYRHMP